MPESEQDLTNPRDSFDPFGLPYPQLEALVRRLGGAPVHAQRWFRALHRTGAAEPDPALQLSRRLTRALRERMRPCLPVLAERQHSADGTLKLRVRLTDGAEVETVLIPDALVPDRPRRGGERLTLCLSSQAGCALGCRFCATGLLGLRRNLAAGEIVGQLLLARAEAQRAGLGAITNLVFMGMGEPLHNWPAVRDAVEILHAPNGHNFSRHKITISTSGVLPRLEDVVLHARTGLALSLHGTREDERTALMPLHRAWPLAGLMAELRRLALHHGARIMIQYLLLAGENDSPRHAEELWAWLRDWPCHVNLLEYNAVPGLPFRRTHPEAAQRFKTLLLERGLRVNHRASRGLDIAGACGQLANLPAELAVGRGSS